MNTTNGGHCSHCSYMPVADSGYCCGQWSSQMEIEQSRGERRILGGLGTMRNCKDNGSFCALLVESLSSYPLPSFPLKKSVESGKCGHFKPYLIGGSVSKDWDKLTSVEVSISEGLQNVVHGPHVEQEAELSDAHGQRAEQENWAHDAPREWLSCRGERKRTQLRARAGKTKQPFESLLLSSCGLQSISRSMVERQRVRPSLPTSSFCFTLLLTLRRRPTVVTCW